MHDDTKMNTKVDNDSRRIHDTVAGNIRAARARLDIKQRDLADRMKALGHNWHRLTVSRVERGYRKVSAEEVVGLCVALQVDRDDLLPRQEQRGGQRA